MEVEAAARGDLEPVLAHAVVERGEHHPDEALRGRRVGVADPDVVGRRVQEALERRALRVHPVLEQPREVGEQLVGRVRGEVVELLGIDLRVLVGRELGGHLLDPQALAKRHGHVAHGDPVGHQARDHLGGREVSREPELARGELRAEVVDAGLEQERPLILDDPLLVEAGGDGCGRVARLDREHDLVGVRLLPQW